MYNQGRCDQRRPPGPNLAGNIPVVKNGFMQVSSLPGLGILLDQGYLKANLADGEPWWG